MLAGAIHLAFEVNAEDLMHSFMLPILEMGFKEEVEEPKPKRRTKKMV